MKTIIGLLIFVGLGITLQHFISKEGLCSVDPKIKQYVNEWKSDMDNAGIDYKSALRRIDKIYFYKNSDSKLGYSEYGKREVWLSTSLLDKDPYLIRAALYHELGHYIFHLQHSTGIMSENKLGGPGFYEANWQDLLHEYTLKCKESKVL